MTRIAFLGVGILCILFWCMVVYFFGVYVAMLLAVAGLLSIVCFASGGKKREGSQQG